MGVLLKEMSRTPDLPVILTGDMNDYEDSPMYVRALNAGLRDSAKIAETTVNAEGVTFNDYGKSSLPRIDFCFVSEEINVSYCEIDDSLVKNTYPSDHFPLIVKLKI